MVLWYWEHMKCRKNILLYMHINFLSHLKNDLKTKSPLYILATFWCLVLAKTYNLLCIYQCKTLLVSFLFLYNFYFPLFFSASLEVTFWMSKDTEVICYVQRILVQFSAWYRYQLHEFKGKLMLSAVYWPNKNGKLQFSFHFTVSPHPL